MSRSKATRPELEAALAQVRSSKMTIKGKRPDGSRWTKREKIADLEARIAACPPEKGLGGARVAAVRVRERERIDRMVSR